MKDSRYWTLCGMLDFIVLNLREGKPDEWVWAVCLLLAFVLYVMAVLMEHREARIERTHEIVNR